MAAVVTYPNRNIALRQGTRIIKRHDGEPRPEPPIQPKDPNLRSSSAHLIEGRKLLLLGYIEAVSEAAAIERAVVAVLVGRPEAQAAGCKSAARVLQTPRTGKPAHCDRPTFAPPWRMPALTRGASRCETSALNAGSNGGFWVQ